MSTFSETLRQLQFQVRITLNEKVQHVIICHRQHKDDDHAPKVSRLLSREDSQDSLEAWHDLFTPRKTLGVAASCESHDVEIWYWYIRIWKRLKYRHQQRIVDNYNDIGRVALLSRDAFTNLAGFRFGGSLGRGTVSVSGILKGNPLANLLGMRFNGKICFVSFCVFGSCRNIGNTI